MPQRNQVAASPAGSSNKRLVRKRELLAMLPFSAATLHRKVKAGDFVTPIKLGPRITAYDLQAVNDWLATKGRP